MKLKLAESRDCKILLHLSIYFANILHLARIQLRIRRLNSPMTHSRILAGTDSIISLTCSLAGMTVTVTNERYVEMFQKIFPEDSPNNNSILFMQDGAPAHTSKMAMEWLKDRFPEKLIWPEVRFGPHVHQI